jgi:SpoVK/Ycf46/Vps4 family AAA+-type ATPase
MATARQIIALLNSHVRGDNEQVLAIALQVAASEAERGRQEIANELKRLVEQARRSSTSGEQKSPNPGVPIPIARPKGELLGLLSVSYPKVLLTDLIASDSTERPLRLMLDEQRRRDRLRSHGQVPGSKLLLAGPPGTGKTFTASAIAGELHLPLMTIRLDGLITRFMGETAAKLRVVFDQVLSVRGVYFFDEFDAIGGKRTADNDVAEMRRVLGSFLSFLEEPNSTDSVVVAATNHPELLDKALFRRFDEVVTYELPNRESIIELLSNRLGSYRPTRTPWSRIAEAAHGLSHAELARAADRVIKHAILRNETKVSPEQIIESLGRRRINDELFKSDARK